MLFSCWASVVDGETIVKQDRVDASFLLDCEIYIMPYSADPGDISAQT